MKRFFFTIILMALLVVFMDPAEQLMSKFLRLEQPETHEVQEGEWLSKVALKYYGEVSYWRELALINRAPDGNLIYPGEKIIVPSFEAIQRVRNAQRLSTVNEIVGIQEDILAGRISHQTEPVAEVQSQPPQVDREAEAPEFDSEIEAEEEPFAAMPEAETYGSNGEQESSFFLSTPVITGLVILAVFLAIVLVMFLRNKKRQEEVSYYGTSEEDDDEALRRERSVYYYGDDEEKRKKKETEVVEK